jgi:3-dehydroquinate synthase
MSMMKIASNIRDYEVHFPETPDFLKSLGKIHPRCYVIDHNVWRLYQDGRLKEIPRDQVIVQPISEEGKSLESVQALYDRLTGLAAKRNMTLISIGGGILQDIAGFVASTLYRGINWVFIPTTLLAQADSCIGSKTSLNYRGFKNLIGTFYPPSAVYIHTPFLATQEETDFFSGVGEVVKLHILGGTEKAREIVELLPRILRRDAEAMRVCVSNSLRIKQGYISEDEFDTGRRNILNFGHCFGHALEANSNFAIPHGQAIVIGMLLANRVAVRRRVLSPKAEKSLAENLLVPSLTVRPRASYLDPQGILEGMKKDKKRTGEGLALILMAEGYQMSRVNDLTESEVRAVLQEADWF